MPARGQGRYVLARGSKTKLGRFKAAVKKIVLGTSETKRRFVTQAAPFQGDEMVLTGTATTNAPFFSGLWLNSRASAVTLARPDTALLFPPNAVYGAIAKGDNSNEREGDNVDLTFINNKFSATLFWDAADSTAMAHQRIVCLEFLICWKDPVIARTMALGLSAETDPYLDNVFRILVGAKMFDNQFSLTGITGNTLASNTLASNATTSLNVLKSGYKEWTRDYTDQVTEEMRNAKALGTVIKTKWHTWKRPHATFEHSHQTHSTGIPIDTTVGRRVAVFELGANDDTSGEAQYEVNVGPNTTPIRLGFKMHFKKPIRLVYLSSNNGDETADSLPSNKTLNYGTLWWSDDGPGCTAAIKTGGAEMRWKDP